MPAKTDAAIAQLRDRDDALYQQIIEFAGSIMPCLGKNRGANVAPCLPLSRDDLQLSLTLSARRGDQLLILDLVLLGRGSCTP